MAIKFPPTAINFAKFGDNDIFFPAVTVGVTTFLLIAASSFHLFKQTKQLAQVKDHAEHEKMKTGKKRKVCLFGTSANPPTIDGHKSIVSSLSALRCNENLNSPKQFDEIRVLPVFKHMYSEKSGLAGFHHRLEMCRISFRDIPNVNVSDQERTLFDHIAKKKGCTSDNEKMNLSVGTYDLLRYLEEENGYKEVKEEFTLAMGADTFMDLTSMNKWKKSEEIILMLDGRFVVKLRKGEKKGENLYSESEVSNRIVEVNKFIQKKRPSFEMKVQLFTGNVSDSSSSAARETSEDRELAKYVGDDVKAYIEANHLYKF